MTIRPTSHAMQYARRFSARLVHDGGCLYRHFGLGLNWPQSLSLQPDVQPCGGWRRAFSPKSDHRIDRGCNANHWSHAFGIDYSKKRAPDPSLSTVSDLGRGNLMMEWKIVNCVEVLHVTP
jgi:hypothetical protein